MTKKLIIAGILTMATFAAFSNTAFANTFNNDPYDFETLRVGNVTQNPNTTSANWGTYINANPGDVLSLAIYYHNSSGLAANNPKVNLYPIDSSAKTNHTFQAQVWADGFLTAYGTITVNLSQAKRIYYIDGSTTWRPNQTVYSSQPLPNGQNDKSVFSPAGLNLGSILSGWPSQGNVMIGFKVEDNGQPIPTTTTNTSVTPIINNYTFVTNTIAEKPAPTISIVKEVSNLTYDNGTKTEISAMRGDSVRFKITIKNNGSATLKNVELQDTLSKYLRFVSEPENQNSQEPNKKATWYLGDINIGGQKEIILEAIVTEDAPLSSTIKNGGTNTVAEADNTASQSANETFVNVYNSRKTSAAGGAAGISFSGLSVIGLLGFSIALILIIWFLVAKFRQRK